MIVAYALAGEGRGHTTRAMALAHRLQAHGHTVHFFTCGDARDLLVERFGSDRVHELPTPRFVIGHHGISYIRTGLASLRFFAHHRRRVKNTVRTLSDLGADVLISDFEPTFGPTARRLEAPFIAFNSQRFVLDADLSQVLNRRQRMKLLPVRIMCRLFARKPDLSIVSKGFNLQPNKPNAHLVGPMLRDAIHLGAWQPAGTHVLAYLRASVMHHLPAMAEHARQHGMVVKLYGHYPAHPVDNVECCPISNDGFIRDLLSADWIYQTAGTQLLGEVASVGVPSLCFPEPGQVEQEINGVLASHAYSNVTVMPRRGVTVGSLNAALQATLARPRALVHDNGADAAASLVVTFMNAQSVASLPLSPSSRPSHSQSML
jgi:uncharacterized protein (TIGR00661 family)